LSGNKRWIERTWDGKSIVKEINFKIMSKRYGGYEPEGYYFSEAKIIALGNNSSDQIKLIAVMVTVK
jgi:hypothetical protein